LHLLIEGEVKDGEPSGFARYINGLQWHQFIGNLDGLRPTGKGVYYFDLDFMYMGIWSKESDPEAFKGAPPLR